MPSEVARLAGLTAERLGLPPASRSAAGSRGWLHDVGKLAVPEQILTKPGPLDEAEWALMRTHPVSAQTSCSRVPALREAAPAVRHHHERYSGNGYPDDLAGQAIPIEARIIAAADAYAAMTADRPYSAARTPQQAAAELRRSAGSHLDPTSSTRCSRCSSGRPWSSTRPDGTTSSAHDGETRCATNNSCV